VIGSSSQAIPLDFIIAQTRTHLLESRPQLGQIGRYTIMRRAYRTAFSYAPYATLIQSTELTFQKSEHDSTGSSRYDQHLSYCFNDSLQRDGSKL
jgi:hypothetical protein